jgi:two-component system, OmpR family, sensor histidine kinase ChvG
VRLDRLLGRFRFQRQSMLRQRILLVNLLSFCALCIGLFTVQSTRNGLVNERLAGIEEQARIVAGTLAEDATKSDGLAIDQDKAPPLMRELMSPTRLRGRLYDRYGTLVVDSRDLLARNMVQISDLPPIDDWDKFTDWLSRMRDNVVGVRPFQKYDAYFEAGADGRDYREVKSALEGETASAERIDERDKLVLSVAVPVQRFKAIYGVLFVSTEEGDIDDILREENSTLLLYCMLALIGVVVSSVYLSGSIAEPVKRLAEAADQVRSGRAGREALPDMTGRNDEIGDLATSFTAMTRALYNRIDAIESFAADVAHELKNPLTSLRSAVDMLSRAADDAARARLMDIVRADVKRIDRLITDISDASRLDAELSREAREPVEIGRFLDTIREVYGFMEIPRGVKLEIELRFRQPICVMGRDERLGQVVRNLIDNAISFSPDGGTVRVSAWADLGSVDVAIEDEGPGIPPENLETIFQRFYTSRPAEQGFGKNSGLGLSIARQIVNGHGGHIWAENRTGGGARFIFELPQVQMK